jgi:hypothetical protein
MGKHQIVVSAENNPYMGWQSQLFYFSCVTRLNQQPIIIVHDSRRNWYSGFYDLVKAGCAVFPAPNYRFYGSGDDYACRNHPGSLIEAAKLLTDQNALIVLCDPDLIFTRAIEFPEVLSGEFSSILNYESDFVGAASQELGIDSEAVKSQKDSLSCSVPYIIPIQQAHEFGTTWLQAIDAFRPRQWEDVMYGFGLAVVKLGLQLNITRLADTNYFPDEEVRAAIIHYAYADERWDKRHYFTVEQAATVWHQSLETTAGTIRNEILTQIREAGDFYRDPYFSAQVRST